MSRAFVTASFLLIATVARCQSTSNYTLATPEQVCLSEVLITPQSVCSDQIGFGAAQQKAEQVRTAAQAGTKFSELARANSQGPSAEVGGGIGCFEKGQLAEPFEELAFRMKIGEISDVLRVKQGFVIIQRTERQPEPPPQIRETTVERRELPTGVRGFVFDKGGNPIAGAYVWVHGVAGMEKSGRTDDKGKYSIPLPQGLYDVFISSRDSSPTARRIEVRPDGMMVFDAVLEINLLGMQVN